MIKNKSHNLVHTKEGRKEETNPQHKGDRGTK